MSLRSATEVEKVRLEHSFSPNVIPAQAGIQVAFYPHGAWIPASAGMTGWEDPDLVSLASSTNGIFEGDTKSTLWVRIRGIHRGEAERAEFGDT